MQRTALFLLFIGMCMLFFSACDVPNGDGSYTSTDSQPSGTDYRSMAYQDATNAGIPADRFVRQINMESGFNPNVVSSAGAIGIAQIMPATAQSWGVDPYDPVASLQVASQHMAWYYAHYGYDYRKALGAYNAGVSTVNSAETRCGWSWQQCVPAETQRYITAIMS
jgi:soluble lytic murein transglycosylase-like protein